MKITAQITDETATVTMTRAEALVLFEFLSRFDRDEQLDIRDKAEELILWHVHGAFERVLAGAFRRRLPQEIGDSPCDSQTVSLRPCAYIGSLGVARTLTAPVCHAHRLRPQPPCRSRRASSPPSLAVVDDSERLSNNAHSWLSIRQPARNR